jgi:hypothetical protein
MLRGGDHKDIDDFVILGVRQLNSKGKNLFLEIQSQSHIVFVNFRPTLCQVRALDLQHFVVIDDPPQKGPRVHSALPEVDLTLCRKVTSGEFIFIFGDWDFLVGG